MSKTLMVAVGWVTVLAYGIQGGLGGVVARASVEEVGAGTQAKVATIRAGDRVLFVGDDMTQQMFYTRATASALLSIMPDGGLRFFNGGREGSMAKHALDWVGPLMELSRPTVVFVCFGFSEAHEAGESDSVADQYKVSLAALIEKIRGNQGVREVVIVGPPAVASVIEGDEWSARNKALAALSVAAAAVAAQQQAGFIDLYEHMALVYREAQRVGGEALTIGGWLPSEAGHVIVASLLLRGVGVTAEQLEEVGWSPLRPVQMRRIRQALAIPQKPPQLEPAQNSRDLYESIRPFDERFFRLWRLSSRKGPGAMAADQAAAEEAWAKVQQLAQVCRQAVVSGEK